MGTEGFKGALLAALVIASIIALAILLLSPSPVQATLAPHDPIYIEGNDNFTPANGVVAGSGTENDPYIIENWDINALSAHGIEVRNTTVHFIIRNCYVHDGWGNSKNGIYFENVKNGRIDNNLVVNNYHGIYLDHSSNNTLTNNTCDNNYREGIYLFYTHNSTLSNNTCKNNHWRGIKLGYSDNNLIDNNLVENNDWSGIVLYPSSNNTLINNTCNRNGGGIHLRDSDNNTLDNNTYSSNSENGINLDHSSNNTIKNNTCSNNSRGIYLYNSSNYNVLKNNTCSKNLDYGIYLYYSDNNTLDNNTCENDLWNGIYLDYSNNNTLTNNTCENNHWRGIDLHYSDNNFISNNVAKNNDWTSILLYCSSNNVLTNNTCDNNGAGISISNYWDKDWSSSNNLIESCTFSNNDNYGIYIGSGSNNFNRIYHNNIINNATQAYDSSSNYWDDGYPSGGNYWSDYTGVDENMGENQDIPWSDGIGDTPYYILGDNNRDRYPLVWTGTAVFRGLENLCAVRLEKNLDLYQGSKLVVKFYTYADAFEGENVLENFSLPWHVEESESVPHPQDLTVKKARLDLTTDDTENVIATIATFIVDRNVLMGLIIEKYLRWPFASPAEKDKIMEQFIRIYMQWPFAP